MSSSLLDYFGLFQFPTASNALACRLSGVSGVWEEEGKEAGEDKVAR